MVKPVPHDVRFFTAPAELRDWFETLITDSAVGRKIRPPASESSR